MKINQISKNDSKIFYFVIYKIIFPNNKIYIGKDIGKKGHSFNYFGSWNDEYVKKDFTKEELNNFTITKEILFESNNKSEINKKEVEFIKNYQSNNPDIGYNRWPKYNK